MLGARARCRHDTRLPWRSVAAARNRRLEAWTLTLRRAGRVRLPTAIAHWRARHRGRFVLAPGIGSLGSFGCLIWVPVLVLIPAAFGGS